MIDHLIAFFMMVAMGGSSADFLARHQIPGTEPLIGFSFFLLYFFYYLIFEWLLGATPGKLITGLTVRSLDGSRCTLRQALLRTSTRILETNPILLGKLPAAIIAFKSKRHQRWGDQWAGTVVVEKSRVS